MTLTSAFFCSAIEMPTHLISVDYTSSYPYATSDGNNDDTSVQESVKIENRQLYDTVKHAYGYDPDARNNSSNFNEETTNKLNTSAVKIFIPPRNSAVIQAIPRKVRGPGSITSSTMPTSSPLVRPPSSLQSTAKDYGNGEPTTTIVYATSIPTTTLSRTYVNIRPVPLLPVQKYRSTIVEIKQPEKNQDTNSNPKTVLEKFNEDQQHQQQEKKSQMNVVLEKPTLKIETASDQTATTPKAYETTPFSIEQRNRNLYKSIPYARIRTNEDVDENSFVNPYPNHKWTNEDNIQRMLPPPPTPPTPPQFVYENYQNPQQNFYPSPTHQNIFSSSQYSTPSTDDYQDEMYRGISTPSPIFVPNQQSIAPILPQQHQRQQYQPLTVRDFELLLQLLILRERRLHAFQEQYPPLNDFSGETNYFDMPKASIAENQYHKTRGSKYTENSIPRLTHPSSTRLLPSNVREELLFRMLLLALHLQPQPPKPIPLVRNSQILPQYMYLGPPSSSSMASSQPFLGFRQRYNGNRNNPVRSVQVLGEID